ncbi:dTMP kinase [Streptomyces sp. NPDC054912]
MSQTIALPAAFAPVPYADQDVPFIALESVSGVGKSTLTAILAHRLNGSGIHTLAPPHSGWSDAAHRLSPLPILAFYLSGLLHVSDRIRRALAIGPVIADRYASSVTACQAAIHGVDITEVDRLIAPFRPYLVVPDHTFYLRCSEETLRQRMAAKGDTKQDDTDLLTPPRICARPQRLRRRWQGPGPPENRPLLRVSAGRQRDERALPPEGVVFEGELTDGYRVTLAGRAIGLVSDEAGAVPSRGRFHAWSMAFGPRGFHATQAEVVERVVAAWLNCGPIPRLMTAQGTVHAARPAAAGMGAAGRVPACMKDRAAAGLRVLLPTGRDVTCRHCPEG